MLFSYFIISVSLRQPLITSIIQARRFQLGGGGAYGAPPVLGDKANHRWSSTSGMLGGQSYQRMRINLESPIGGPPARIEHSVEGNLRSGDRASDSVKP